MTLQEKMRELFLLEQQIRGLRTRLDAATVRVGKQKTKLEQMERQRLELSDQLKQVQVKASSLEKQSNELEARIELIRNQMNSVKTNKEYSALLVEVNTFKSDKSKIEDEALGHLTKLDALRGEVAGADAKIEEQKKTLALAEGEVKAAESEIAQQLQEVTSRRDEAAKQVPDTAMTVFRKVSVLHDGEAMAVIIEESRKHKEYSCGGCYIGLPVERVNAAMRRPEDVVTCPSCGRILYLDGELKAVLTGSNK